MRSTLSSLAWSSALAPILLVTSCAPAKPPLSAISTAAPAPSFEVADGLEWPYRLERLSLGVDGSLAVELVADSKGRASSSNRPIGAGKHTLSIQAIARVDASDCEIELVESKAFDVREGAKPSVRIELTAVGDSDWQASRFAATLSARDATLFEDSTMPPDSKTHPVARPVPGDEGACQQARDLSKARARDDLRTKPGYHNYRNLIH